MHYSAYSYINQPNMPHSQIHFPSPRFSLTMRREGRPHGMVRTYRILPPSLNPRIKTRFINRFDSPPTAGLFTKLPNKPTNHSKFTGRCPTPRCNACHVSPSSKSTPKSKGSLKAKSSDVLSKTRPDFALSGLSVTRMLDHLAVDFSDDDEIAAGDDYTASPEQSYSFADLFRRSDCVDNISSFDDVENEIDYEVDEEGGEWYLVESYS